MPPVGRAGFFFGLAELALQGKLGKDLMPQRETKALLKETNFPRTNMLHTVHTPVDLFILIL